MLKGPATDVTLDYEESNLADKDLEDIDLRDEYQLFTPEYNLRKEKIGRLEIDKIESLEPYPDQKVAQQE